MAGAAARLVAIGAETAPPAATGAETGRPAATGAETGRPAATEGPADAVRRPNVAPTR